MSDIPEDDLEETRAALAPTLDATAAILPWLTKPKAKRFDPKLNDRWISSLRDLDRAWTERHQHGLDPLRPCIFTLYSLALETHDADCLRLGEALASAADRFDDAPPSPRLAAALSATLESLNVPAGLEHEAFAERARHFAGRLEQWAAGTADEDRSAVLDQLFIAEANEHVELLRDALAALPPDAYALSTESATLAQTAELAEMWGIMHLARKLADTVNQCAGELDRAETRTSIEEILDSISSAVASIEI